MKLLIFGWLAVMVATIATAAVARLNRGHHGVAAWKGSLRACGFAAFPGIVLFSEFVAHAVLSKASRIPGPAVYDYWGTLLSVLGIFGGPLFFGAAYYRRPGGRVPMRVGVLVFLCFWAWVTSSLTALVFALSV
ncbi:MAG TPA: hypothetical protein VFQ61_09255 [Polyangiaceae bacterium]|nr:hypothetical protein [Polyangiaceae bacterium]